MAVSGQEHKANATPYRAARVSEILAQRPAAQQQVFSRVSRELNERCGDKTGREITAADIAHIQTRWAQNTPNTRKAYNGELRVLLALVGANPELSVNMRGVPSTQPRNVTCPESEWQRTWAEAPPRLRLLMGLCRDSGLRAMTALSLTASSVDPETLGVSARTKRGSWIKIPTSQRTQTLLALALGRQTEGETLWQALGGSAVEFSHNQGRSHYTLARLDLSNAKKRAGCTGAWMFHDLRRTGARDLYRRVTDLRKVQHFMGHSGLAQTLYYLMDDTVRPTAAELEPDTQERSA